MTCPAPEPSTASQRVPSMAPRESAPSSERSLRDKPQEHAPDEEVDSDKLFGPFLSW